MSLTFELTCQACPEQYDVYNTFDTPAGPIKEIVAYVRLRWSKLKVYYPDVGGELIYQHEFEEDDGYKGCFDTEHERDYYIKQINDRICEVLLEKQQRTR